MFFHFQEEIVGAREEEVEKYYERDNKRFM